MNIKKLASFSFGPITGAIFGFITLPLLAWYFSPDDVGHFSMLQVTLNMGVMLFSLALHQSYVREYHETSDKGQLLALSFWPGAIFLLLVIVLLECFSVSCSALVFGESDRYLDYSIYLGIFLSLVINSLAHVLRMQERGVAFSLTQIAPRAALVIFVGVVICTVTNYNYRDIVFSNVLALLCSSLLFVFLIWKDIALSISAFKNINWRFLKRMLIFTLPLVAGGAAYWALTAVDRFFIQKYSGFERLGVYAVANAIAASATVLTSIFSTLWHPAVYRWAKEGADVQKVQCVVDYVFITALLIWSLVGIFSCVINFILPPVYSGVQYLLVLCFSVPLLYLISETTMVGIGISRKSSYAMLASIVALITSIIFNYLFVPVLAEKGAAISSMLAFVVFFIIRTESTCFLWEKIKRQKMYTLIFVYVLCSITCSLVRVPPVGTIFLWSLLFLMSVLVYRERIKTAISFLRNRNAFDL